MGLKKVPLISVVPPSSLIAEGVVMRYGAFQAPRRDGGFGYGPYNWRDPKTPIHSGIYVDAVLRHVFGWFDREENAPDSQLPHLWHAKATLGVLIDAIEVGNIVDDRPPAGTSSKLFDLWRLA